MIIDILIIARFIVSENKLPRAHLCHYLNHNAHNFGTDTKVSVFSKKI